MSKPDKIMLIDLELSQIKEMIEDIAVEVSKNGGNVSEELARVFLYLAFDDFLKATLSLKEETIEDIVSHTKMSKRLYISPQEVETMMSDRRKYYLNLVKDTSYEHYAMMPKPVENIVSNNFDDLYEMFYELYSD